MNRVILENILRTINIKVYLLLLTMLLFGYGQTQNLVPNSNFEQETILNVDSNCIKYSFPHWESLNDYQFCGISKTLFFDYSEYLKKYKDKLSNYYENWNYDHGCIKYNHDNPKSRIDENYVCFFKYNSDNILMTRAVDTTNRFYKAKDGNSYIMNLVSYSRELFQAKLNKSLKKDSCYLFEMYYYFPRFFSEDTNIFTAGKFGAYFTKSDFIDIKSGNFYINYNYTPQVLLEELDTNALKDWVKYSQVFTVKENSDFIIIGNHQPFNNQEIYSPITFYIDCLKIVEYKCPELDSEINDSTKFKLH